MANPIKIKAHVDQIQNHGDGIYSVVFKPQRRVPRFQPGQFLHLAIDDYDPRGGDWPESRVFSIASSRLREDIVINYSVKGQFTTRMSDQLEVGGEVWLKLPYGDFIIEKNIEEDQDIILIAGGTGLSPYLSYLEEQVNSPGNRKIHLVYGVRKERHILNENLLCNCLDSVDGFKLEIFMETESNGKLFNQNVQPKSGMITLDHILKIGVELEKPVFFLSGPIVMIQSFKAGLREAGIPLARIRIDEWE
ncbi:MAG: FAD-dependent oxidoreductase [Deltaproteobacteria bacterium]|nr:FAD-dependent oxidoreductase [Deltaproteobacteria bacterium]